MIMNRSFFIVCVLAACGGKSSTDGTGPSSAGSGSATDDPPGVVADTRTELDKRRDAACDTLGPRMTACALEEAKAAHAAGKLKKAELDEISKPEVLQKNTDEFLKQCKVPMSKHQVRVLEVCPQEESECGPLLSCLEHLDDKPEPK